MLWNPEARLEHFVSVVEGDPALTAAVLRAANSALSAPIEPIANAHEAILRVGLETARQVMSAALLSSAFDRFDDAGLDVQDLWRHLLATALLAELLASDEDRNMAFVAGLLHDIGRLSMAAQNPARYRQVVELVRHGIAPEDAERRRYGLTHRSWGARLCETWRLPEPTIAVASDHHEPDAGGLAGVVYQARELAWSLGYGDGVVRPGEDELAGDPPESPALEAIGGRAGLGARIRWYREAFAPR